ncbi:hypothetical protein J4Q44_G00254730 [Coregonus suidteri]|uniref:Ig-like domain-containing protein n=1 Tax=Coregonus suidteri TaxID=861788 RepID=A0AAN8LB19_9TELE
MIIVVFLVCSLYLPWTKGSSVHIVHQSPSALIKIHGSSVDQEIHCSHSIVNYDRMLWYKQDRNRTLILLGYLNLNYAYSEEYAKEKISLQGDGRSYGNLSISDLKSEDSAVYFCAALPQCSRLPPTATKTLICLSLCLSVQESWASSPSLSLSFNSKGFYWHGKHMLTLPKQVK